jgi:NAD(P)-dependent dehydrogenase (short-subunit alcohol dehydrogenase family)
MDFTNRVAVVTGGASGIGLSCAILAARNGATVVINDLDEERTRSAADQVGRATGQEAFVAPADVADQTAVEGAVSKIVERLGRIDVLINNAGFATSAPAENYPQWQRMLDVNLSGAYYWARAAAAASMIKRRSGSIVNVASIAAFNGVPHDVGYVVTKHGLVGLTRALAIDWAPYDIRVNCLCPAFTNTPILQSIEAIQPDRFAGRRERIPLGRAAEAEEQARSILFLASDLASYCTGATLINDGGQSALSSGYSPLTRF